MWLCNDLHAIELKIRSYRITYLKYVAQLLTSFNFILLSLNALKCFQNIGCKKAAVFPSNIIRTFCITEISLVLSQFSI